LLSDNGQRPNIGSNKLCDRRKLNSGQVKNDLEKQSDDVRRNIPRDKHITCLKRSRRDLIVSSKVADNYALVRIISIIAHIVQPARHNLLGRGLGATLRRILQTLLVLWNDATCTILQGDMYLLHLVLDL
tara:strand:- start:3745 stop:4134 length:390 start_codon:yes stop_codon:yes gene_type:complete